LRDSQRYLHVLLEQGGHFINLNSEVPGRLIPRLFRAATAYSHEPPWRIEEMLQFGASIHSRDAFGRNVLHYFVEHMHNPHLVTEKHALLLLIRRGADIYAIDGHGRSVSDIVNTNLDIDDFFELGSFRRDLWGIILEECMAEGIVERFEVGVVTPQFSRRYTAACLMALEGNACGGDNKDDDHDSDEEVGVGNADETDNSDSEKTIDSFDSVQLPDQSSIPVFSGRCMIGYLETPDHESSVVDATPILGMNENIDIGDDREVWLDPTFNTSDGKAMAWHGLCGEPMVVDVFENVWDDRG
jgi:hypothetical protein